MSARRFLMSLAVGVALAGCSKNAPAPTTAPVPKAAGVSVESQGDPVPAPVTGDASAPTATAPPPPDPNAIAAGGSGDPNAPEGKALADIQYAYFAYCREHTAPPRDLSVLVAEHYLPALPVPPAGKKFVLDNKKLTVTLANQ